MSYYKNKQKTHTKYCYSILVCVFMFGSEGEIRTLDTLGMNQVL